MDHFLDSHITHKLIVNQKTTILDEKTGSFKLRKPGRKLSYPFTSEAISFGVSLDTNSDTLEICYDDNNISFTVKVSRNDQLQLDQADENLSKRWSTQLEKVLKSSLH